MEWLSVADYTFLFGVKCVLLQQCAQSGMEVDLECISTFDPRLSNTIYWWCEKKLTFIKWIKACFNETSKLSATIQSPLKQLHKSFSWFEFFTLKLHCWDMKILHQWQCLVMALFKCIFNLTIKKLQPNAVKHSLRYRNGSHFSIPLLKRNTRPLCVPTKLLNYQVFSRFLLQL